MRQKLHCPTHAVHLRLQDIAAVTAIMLQRGSEVPPWGAVWRPCCALAWGLEHHYFCAGRGNWRGVVIKDAIECLPGRQFRVERRGSEEVEGEGGVR